MGDCAEALWREFPCGVTVTERERQHGYRNVFLLGDGETLFKHANESLMREDLPTHAGGGPGRERWWSRVLMGLI